MFCIADSLYCDIYFELYSLSPRSTYSSGNQTFAFFYGVWLGGLSPFTSLPSDQFVSLNKAQGPTYGSGPLPLEDSKRKTAKATYLCTFMLPISTFNTKFKENQTNPSTKK